MENLYTGKIDIEAPPQMQRKSRKPLFMTIGPSFTMAIPMLLGSGMSVLSSSMRGAGSGVYMFTGLITALASAAVGVFWALSNLKYERSQEVEAVQNLCNAYGIYLQERAAFIKDKYEYNKKVLNNRYLSAQTCSTYDRTNTALWNRNLKHEDFLYTRLGVGNIPFQAQITIPDKKFHISHDELEEKPAVLKHNYETLYNVPVGIDLQKIRLVGIVGGQNRAGAVRLMHNIVAQIAVNNCYTEVRMVFIYQTESVYDEQEWSFAKWLPHVWDDNRKTRFVASDKSEVSDVCYELAGIFRTRDEESRESSARSKPQPHYIIFVRNRELLSGELITKYMFDPKEEYGLTTILMEENYEDLPNACEHIIHNDGNETSLYNVSASSTEKTVIKFDYVSAEELEGLARRLGDIEVHTADSNGDIPASLDFLEMYGVEDLEGLQVLERWTKNKNYDSMKVLIGKKAGGAECYLDIHEKYHGPHGLVAGTTGSGKSETLQTYMLSLAINFSPSDIGFFIIDFKGGGMANLFSGLPHLIGQISNLSGNQVQRAMISIKSENKRRQRVFSEHGVNNINLYTKLYKNGEARMPIPHLFIIIDEFAELKREEPEFMKELISVAQVGRSLGVHLILATQKPSGTVDNNIWSNTKFRLCLRVQDRQDSNDMLHKPDAAYITQAGRGYLQVGNDELYELFQSGYSGAMYNPDSDYSGSIATMITMTGKAAVVGNKNKRKKLEQQKNKWIYTLYCQSVVLLNDMKMNFNTLSGSDDMFRTFTVRLAEELKKQGYDYEWNPYNIARIKDFVEVCTHIPLEDPQVVNYIAPQAQTMRKKLPELKEKTQLDAVVEYLGQIAHNNGYEQNLTLWLPVLPVMLGFERLKGVEHQFYRDGAWPVTGDRWNLNVMIGLYDDPENQQQAPLVINFAENGHLAVCGTVVSGKSTFLQSLLYALVMKYSPEYLNIYALDYSSRSLAVFEDDKHTGGIMNDSDLEKTARFFNMLEKMMDERKRLFKGANYSQYVQVNGIKLPAVVVVIDNFANFKEKTENMYESTLIRLSREGVGYGIYMVISSAGFGSAEIQTRIADNIRTVIALEMGDKFKMADVLRATRIDVMPEPDVKGRGLAYVDGRLLEFQTAVAMETEDDYERAAYIQKQCGQMSRNWNKPSAKRVPEIPEKPVFEVFEQLSEYEEAKNDMSILPMGYYLADASMYSISLKDTYCYIISGKARTGKTNLLKVLICSARAKDAEICLIENDSSRLKTFAAKRDIPYISDDKSLFEYFKSSIPTFRERNIYKKQLQEMGLTDEEIFVKMQKFKPVFIFIDSLTDFIQAVYRKQEDGADMSGYVENITEKGYLHNIYFIGCLNGDESSGCLGLKVYNNMTGYKTGIHVGGNVSAQRMFSFTNIPYAEQGKVTKPGTGLVPDRDENTVARTIVIPMYKGI